MSDETTKTQQPKATTRRAHTAKKAVDAAAAPKAAAKKPVRVERFMRSAVEHTEDTFKLLLSKMKKNYSYKWRQPELMDIEHTHIFHSINDTTLQPNKYCAPVGGHFHECRHYIDEETGQPMVEVGPPLHFVNRKLAGGRVVKRAVPVTFERTLTDAEAARFDADHQIPEYTLEKDLHTHEVEYLGSSTFTVKGKHAARQEEQAKVKGVSVGETVSTQPTSMGRLVAGPEKDKVARVLAEATTPRKDGSDTGAA